MTTKVLSESFTDNVASATHVSGNVWRVKIIEAGRGASAHYPAEILERDAGKFSAGTHIYLDHPTESEDWDRPERSLNDLAGTLVTDGEWVAEENALFAEARFYSNYAWTVQEMSEDIGMSIRASALVHEADDGFPVVDAFSEVLSVDLVTRAGAGGRLVSLIESARPSAQESTIPTPTTKKENGMNEEQEGLLRQAIDSISALATAQAAKAQEAATPVEDEDQPDALEVADALAESDLSTAGRKAALAAHRTGTPLAEAIKAQGEYEQEIAEAAKAEVTQARQVDEAKVNESVRVSGFTRATKTTKGA